MPVPPAPLGPGASVVTPDAARQGPSLASGPVEGVAAMSIEATGRRILSTAFVRVGPDGALTVERRDGVTLVLRDVKMGQRDYCGLRADGARYCGSYADVAAARAGGAAGAERVEPIVRDRPNTPHDPAG